MKKFVKFRGMWREYDESTPIDSATLISLITGNIEKYCDIRNCETVELSNKSELDWYGTPIYNNDYKTGWVTPKGVFFGCNYKSHSYQAQIIHNKSEEQMEREGYIKITYNDILEHPVAYVERKPTFKQISWFMENYNEENRDEILGLVNFARMVLEKPEEEKIDEEDLHF